MNRRIQVLGLGPGTTDWLAPAVHTALLQADIILGYHKYLQQIAAVSPQTPREGSGMRHEVERAQHAIELAQQSKTVALVSGGDAGVYGMAGLVLELLAHQAITAIQVDVLPGITALNAAAALLGAPLMTDFAAISLSDYLIPLETILTRLQAAIQGDFVIGLYNPLSHQRREPFEKACALLLDGMEEDRPVGIVRAAFRPEQEISLIPLKALPAQNIGMDCMVIIGNRTTHISNGKMVTPRGYSMDRAPTRGTNGS